MSNSTVAQRFEQGRVSSGTDKVGAGLRPAKPLVSLVVSAYNEAAIVEQNLAALCRYMKSLEDEYRWELILINDGSSDGTAELAEQFARTQENVRVFHHFTNFGLGQALRFAFKHCKGDYVVTLDLDLSYSPDHIQKLLSKIRETKARIVVTSPYMEGGKVSNVPWMRKILSIWANRFLSLMAKRSLSTLTGMVRAYDGRFLRSLNLKSMGMDINPEIIYKAMLLRARIVEIPAHLCWHLQKKEGVKRKSSMKTMRQVFSVLLSGFLFRPVIFFIMPGLLLTLVSLYTNFWMCIHVYKHYQSFPQYPWFPTRIDAAVASAFSQAPHTFIIGGITLMLAMQFLGLGIFALQSKSYFEETFHLGSSIFKSTLLDERKSDE